MRLRRVEPGVGLGLPRGSAVICIPVPGAAETFERRLASVLAYTPGEVPVLVADDGGAESRVLRVLVDRHEAGPPGPDVYHLRQPAGLGAVENVNACLAMTAPADVVILGGDCEVAAGWFQRLQAAACSDSTVATATPLTNDGSPVSVPDRDHGDTSLPQEWTLEGAAAAIAEASLRLRPHLPALGGHCAYLRRSAIDLVGDFDAAFPGVGDAGVDFSQRCLLRGLAHVAADDVFVLHHGSRARRANLRDQGVEAEPGPLVRRRYPSYPDAVIAAAAPSTPLARALAVASRALTGLSVTIDGSCFGEVLSGTRVHTLEVIDALHRVGGARLRVVVPRTCGAEVQDFLAGLSGVEVADVDAVDERTSPTDVVHRPYQVGRFHELRRLRQLGRRVVITQQDLIAYRNPGYFDDFREWQRYRRLARVTLAQAERAVFFSRHAACEALAEDLVDEGRSRVVYLGVDHRHGGAAEKSRRPALPEGVEARGILLCLGVDFAHKNRLFALRVLEQLQARHGWAGHLVLAGPRASPGSSADDDQAYLGAHEPVAAATTVLGQVTEEERRWLLGHAALVIAPSTYEGFGLMPFEAAEAGAPCFYAPQGAMAEVLPPELARIEPWDAAETADRAAAVMADPDESSRLVEAVRTAASGYRWDQTARELLHVYREAADAPSRDLIVELAGAGGRRPAGGELREPTLELAKVTRFLRTYGVVQGSVRGGRALAARLRRRLRPGS